MALHENPWKSDQPNVLCEVVRTLQLGEMKKQAAEEIRSMGAFPEHMRHKNMQVVVLQAK